MRRFFASVAPGAAEFKITGDDAHHIANVLRLSPGEQIVVCDSNGLDYISVIKTVSKTEVVCEVISSAVSDGEPKTRVTLYIALPKADKLEFVIQKSVELGAVKIVPCDSERSVTKVDPKKSKAKCDRWNKIAESAAKQSGRGIIPTVSEPLTFKQAAKSFLSHELPILAYEDEHETSLKQVLQKKVYRDIGLFIGSEGGFSKSEADELILSGALSASLGKRILRAETAPIVALSMIFYEYE